MAAKRGRPKSNRKCSYCGGPHYSLGYCRMHYLRKVRTGELGPKGQLRKRKNNYHTVERFYTREQKVARRGAAARTAERFGISEANVYYIVRTVRNERAAG